MKITLEWKGLVEQIWIWKGQYLRAIAASQDQSGLIEVRTEENSLITWNNKEQLAYSYHIWNWIVIGGHLCWDNTCIQSNWYK
jgi:hypothetical protein